MKTKWMVAFAKMVAHVRRDDALYLACVTREAPRHASRDFDTRIFLVGTTKVAPDT
jgi:hypothetical protein